MSDPRKQAISLRMSAADLRRVRRLGERLGAKDSEVMRFAVKCMLSKLAPLCDPETRGRNLLPVFAECGADLLHHFDLDSTRLESIINDGAADEQRVAEPDIELLAMSATPDARSTLSFRLLGRYGGGAEAEAAATPLRNYLYTKYSYTETERGPQAFRQAQKVNGR